MENLLCSRCEGLLSQEKWPSPTTGVEDAGCFFRCIHCGNVEDEVILENRLNPTPLDSKRRHRNLPALV